MKCGTGEADIRHIPDTLIELLRRDEVCPTASSYLPGLILIEDSRAEGVHITIGTTEHSVVDEQPALRGLDGDRTCPDLETLPGTYLKVRRRHHMAMMSPELQIRRLAVKYVTKGGMAVVTWTTQHGVATIDLTREEDAIAIKRQECILQLMEGLEVLRPRYSDGRSMIAIAPRDIVATIDLCHARVVSIDPLPHLGDVALEVDLIRRDVPGESILAKSHVETHPPIGVIAPEDTGKPVPKRDDGTIDLSGSHADRLWDSYCISRAERCIPEGDPPKAYWGGVSRRS